MKIAQSIKNLMIVAQGDDGNDGDDTGGDTASLAAQGGHDQPLTPFTTDQFTHCT
jgi:hypothetical protein